MTMESNHSNKEMVLVAGDDSTMGNQLEPATAQQIAAFKKSHTLLKEEFERQKATLNTLRNSEQSLKHLLWQTPVAGGTVSPDQRFMQVNEQMCCMTGYSENELLTMGLSAISFHDDCVRTKDTIEALVKEKCSYYQAETPFIKKDGTIFWGREIMRMVKDPAGFKYLLFLILDINQQNRVQQKKIQQTLEKVHGDLESRFFQKTARIEAANRELEDKLREMQKARDDLLKKEKHFKAVQAIAGVGSFFASPGRNGFDCSEGFFRIFGHEPCQECANYAFIQRHIHSSDQPRFKTDIDAFYKTFAPFDKGYRIVTPQGGIRKIRMIITARFDQDTAPVEIQGVIQDITESKAKERQEIQNEKLASLGFMASGVAHEINNPNSLISFNIPIMREYFEALFAICDQYALKNKGLELCCMPYEDFKKDVVKLTNNIENGSARINKIVTNFRSFVHMKRDLECQKVDILALIRGCIDISDAKMKKLVRRFEVKIPDDLPKVNIEPEVLEIAVINLLINAAQACDKPDSLVCLSVEYQRTTRPQLIIQVTDNGCGMDEDTLSRAFDPFFSTKSSNMGTGIGLSLCHNRISSLGGNIEVESQPGKGSCFRIILPDRPNKDYTPKVSGDSPL